jgi:hypothetical protein
MAKQGMRVFQWSIGSARSRFVADRLRPIEIYPISTKETRFCGASCASVSIFDAFCDYRLRGGFWYSNGGRLPAVIVMTTLEK